MMIFGEDNFSKTFVGRQLARESFIKTIENQRLNGEPPYPRVGKYERPFLDELQKYTEFRINRNPMIIGYFPDGYIKELNLVIEFDEPWHTRSCYVKHDLKKDEDYKMAKLICFRIKKIDWDLDQLKCIERFKIVIKEAKTI